jgi:hypothetical protein
VVKNQSLKFVSELLTLSLFPTEAVSQYENTAFRKRGEAVGRKRVRPVCAKPRLARRRQGGNL